MNILFITKMDILVLIKWSYIYIYIHPSIMLTIELRVVNIF